MRVSLPGSIVLNQPPWQNAAHVVILMSTECDVTEGPVTFSTLRLVNVHHSEVAIGE